MLLTTFRRESLCFRDFAEYPATSRTSGSQDPDEKKLPGIIPVLFYHGEDEWDVSVHFRDMIDSPELTDEFVPDFKCLLRDFSPWGDEKIRGTILLRLFLGVTGHIFSPRFGEAFERMLPLLTELSRKKTGMEYIETVLRYICHTSDTLIWGEMETKLVQAFDEERKGDIMTIADELRMEGEIRGEIKGEIKTYQRLMDNGLIPREVAEKKIAELSKRLDAITVGAHIVPAGTSDAPDHISV